ncbi:helix-hairpin-helix domain-containing protein [Flavivirga amylovorans]|uniref:Helix-hairpin-helix domain-containing protein n=1 Tax=Flavivirga amylovorans TaxID=870486 RepID=A0ABT8X4Q7_9FLAO|nr:helix-hairpin-helix domain-containing protein [Flavivirga amylovorans]MDO5988939.1 helix-hairpin-helix domain-containing protein [Flavivirga amylovorans]
MKSHFMFSKEQRNGIFLLIILIIGLQCIYFFVDFQSEDISVDKETLAQFNEEIDSLRLIKLEKSKPRIYPFNPNYITDFKGASLGMSNKEIDRLLIYREQNNWINSTKQFQEVTKISDSLLNQIAPYFKFPEWVSNSKRKQKPINSYSNTSKSFAQKHDLNNATAQQLQKIHGIGVAFSERIIKFRNKFVGGFIDDIQLQDVYGLTPEIIERITNHFTVKTPRQIKKININMATLESLVTVQHIDYDLAHNIIEQRQLREGYKSLEELKKVKDFPVNKIDIIKLYLSLD